MKCINTLARLPLRRLPDLPNFSHVLVGEIRVDISLTERATYLIRVSSHAGALL